MPDTILLVEDDESLRRLAQRLLVKLGYNVLAAGDGWAAIAQCQEFPDEIQLLITDVFMPDVGGPVLAKRLLAIRPAMKVLYVSGSNEALLDADVLTHASHFLQKPYTQDAIKRKIREILEE
jgi:two-component system cell cycle sensor histidine kinase/response regulator CckA